jgi:hypothetical protein
VIDHLKTKIRKNLRSGSSGYTLVGLMFAKDLERWFFSQLLVLSLTEGFVLFRRKEELFLPESFDPNP